MKIPILSLLLLCFIISTKAQVQVSKEPFHKNVLENRYIRILDVRFQPKDTTLFHIHSTPSVTLMFTTTAIGVQTKGRDWGRGRNVAGRASYSSFLNDTLVHRVTNSDTVRFHVNVIEILSPYKPSTQHKPLPLTVLFDNDKTVAYRLTDASVNEKVINGRGPMVAGLVEGKQIVFHNNKTKKDTVLKADNYLYIEPESDFYFLIGDEKINLVLFEFK